jgi:hypothetical protein
LPCRRSWVRIPSAALKKACICRPFLRAQSACASASGRTDSGLAAGRPSAVPRKTPCLQVDSGSSEPKSFCGPAEGRVFACCGRYPDSYCSGTRQRPPARYQRSRYLGASPVSVRKPRGQPRPAPRQPPASHGAQSRELLRRRRPTQRRGPHNGDLVSPESHGVITEGVAFHRQAGVLRAPPGLGCWLSSKAGVPRQALETLALHGKQHR